MLIDNASILRQNRKTLKITINDNGQLTIFAPIKLSYVKIEEILKAKESLLNKKIKAKKSLAVQNKDILCYKKILLMGKEYIVVPTKKMGKAYFIENNFLIPQKYCDLSKQASFIKKTLRNISNKVVLNRVNAILENRNDKEYKKITKILIGNFKAKWGSCDNEGVLKFNWKIIMLSPELIDFIIFHELTHLKELNHSKNFYYHLQSVVPKHKEYRRKLKTFSFLLSLY